MRCSLSEPSLTWYVCIASAMRSALALVNFKPSYNHEASHTAKDTAPSSGMGAHLPYIHYELQTQLIWRRWRCEVQRCL